MIFGRTYFVNAQTAFHNGRFIGPPAIDRAASKLNRYQLCNFWGSFSCKRLSGKPGGFPSSKLGLLSQKTMSTDCRNKADEQHRKWADPSRAQKLSSLRLKKKFVNGFFVKYE